MSRVEPQADCRDLPWTTPRELSDAAQIALEDYARALLRATSAEALVDPPGRRVTGVHVCGVPSEPTPEARRDLEAFARDMAEREGDGGLGWS